APTSALSLHDALPICERKRECAERACPRELRILDDDCRLGGELRIHVTTDHLAPLRPVGECHARCVTNDKPLAVVPHEGEQGLRSEEHTSELQSRENL